MRLLAALMTSISLVTTALFAYALASMDEQRPTPQIARAASR